MSSRTHSSITIHLGDDHPPTCHTYPYSAAGVFASIDLGSDAALIIRSENIAYALIEALGEAMRFFQNTEPVKAAS